MNKKYISALKINDKIGSYLSRKIPYVVNAGQWLYSPYIGRKINRVIIDECMTREWWEDPCKNRMNIFVRKERYYTSDPNEVIMSVCDYKIRGDQRWRKEFLFSYDKYCHLDVITKIDYKITSCYGADGGSYPDYKWESVSIGRRANLNEIKWFYSSIDYITIPRCECELKIVLNRIREGNCSGYGWNFECKGNEEILGVSQAGHEVSLTINTIARYFDLAYHYPEMFYSKNFWSVNADAGVDIKDRDFMMALSHYFNANKIISEEKTMINAAKRMMYYEVPEKEQDKAELGAYIERVREGIIKNTLREA